ncbi:MAG: phosphopyruvate hydratase [Patescibacteria group bacterium]|nr:phosphopyruvate hydratase [Patescibacteria group bacterium]
MKIENCKLKIRRIKAREIFDSRGKPTVKAEVKTDQGVFSASVPSGVSKGRYEAVSLRAEEVIKNIEEIIALRLKGEDVSNQKKIDQIQIELDGTKNKSKLGANATLAVSIACLRAAAAVQNLSLYKYLSETYNLQLTTYNFPSPCFNILEGGVHAGNDLDIQEFMVIPQRESFKENLRAGVETYHWLKEILKKKFGKQATKMGDEGGFAPPIKYTRDALDLIIEAIKQAGCEGAVKIALDCAASQFYKNGKYHFEDGEKTGEELLNFYQNLLKDYPILFIEDPFDQDDWQSFQTFQKICNESWRLEEFVTDEILLVGDDLTVSNPKRIKEANKKKACKGIILKPNQIGTVTETVEAARLAKEFGWKIIVSHRSGETNDDFIADLAVGIGADFIKSGAPGPKERMAKYNRLLEIEKEL